MAKKKKEHLSSNPSEDREIRSENMSEIPQDDFDKLQQEIQELEDQLGRQIDELSTQEDLQALQEKISRMNVNNEVKERFAQMIEAVEELSRDERKELLEEIMSGNAVMLTSVVDDVFPSHNLAWTKTLEDSPLGQNILKDAAGMAVGAVDSAAIVVKLAWTLIKDIALLPRDLLSLFRRKS